MNSPRWLDRRTGYLVGALAILFGIIAPATFPILASADSLQSRSIEMSSSANGATGVSYKLKATTVAAIDSADGGIIVQFCNATGGGPLVGTACTAPSGLDVTDVASTATGTDPQDGVTPFTAGTATDFGDGSHSIIKWIPTANVAVAHKLDIEFTGITNPDGTDGSTFYARVTTYTSTISSFSDTTPGTTPGTYLDSGGVALATTSTIGVTAFVQEALTFCISDSAHVPNPGCATPTNGNGDPSMTLGETIGGSTQKALESTAVSTAEDIAQLNTNAAHGAVVNLQSDATGCGGLVRKNDTPGNCDIKPNVSTADDIAAGQALFGLQVGTHINDDTGGSPATPTGDLTPVTNYGAGKYFLDYVSGDASGVTSTYGSELFNSGGAPVSGWNLPITFGASVSPLTPAGIYSADLSMIATGTF